MESSWSLLAGDSAQLWPNGLTPLTRAVMSEQPRLGCSADVGKALLISYKWRIQLQYFEDFSSATALAQALPHSTTGVQAGRVVGIYQVAASEGADLYSELSKITTRGQQSGNSCRSRTAGTCRFSPEVAVVLCSR